MKLTYGYCFFDSSKQDRGQTPGPAGYVLVRPIKNTIKVQCVAERLPVTCGQWLNLCLWDSLNIEKPFNLGKMILRSAGTELRGELNFTMRTGGLSPVLPRYDCYALVTRDEIPVMCTPTGKEAVVHKKELTPFDPFNTTNSAYSWDRAENMEELRNKLSHCKIIPLPEIVEEIKEALHQYRHILLGNYKPGNLTKSYYIIGVPGDRPHVQQDQIYRWINKCVSLDEYPFFDGYRLYYFDEESGAVVKAVLRT